jgi:hypothetical protein
MSNNEKNKFSVYLDVFIDGVYSNGNRPTKNGHQQTIHFHSIKLQL